MSKPLPTVRSHLLCPRCEYDLFGQPDALRCVQCPECGTYVDLDTALKDLCGKRVRQAAVRFVLCMAAFAPVVGSAIWCAIDFGPWQLGLGALGSVLWFVLLLLCLRRYSTVRFTVQVLLLYHASFALASIGIALIVGAVAISGQVIARLVLAMMGASIPLFLLAHRLYWRAGGLLQDGHDLSLREQTAAGDGDLRRPQSPVS